MNKKDLIPVVLLILLIPLWMMVDRVYLAPKFAPPAPLEAPAKAGDSDTGTIGDSALSAATNEVQTAVAEAVQQVAAPTEEEQVGTLRNDKVELEITSLGGGIKSATLLDFPEFNEEDSDPVLLSFTNRPALAYTGLDGIEAKNALNLKVSEDGRTAVLSRVLDDFIFERTITLGDDYQLDIKDRFIATANAPCALPSFRLLTGAMQNPADTKATKGVSILGVDSYATNGGLNYWGRKLIRLYKKADKPVKLDAVPEEMQGKTVDWVAAKNKFFTQIVRLEEPVATMAVLSTRDTSQKGLVPHDITAALVFEPVSIAAGDAYELDYDCYIGPKQYSILKDAGNYMEGVMEFETIGKFSWMNWLMEPARKFLLWMLNFFYGIFHNYGVAIILTTLLMRILFWPLTHKSTDKMRENSEKMQVVQPKLKALQEKYKSNPVKLREETMKVYQEHNFNPMGMMGGCLPMFVQLPVFIALYTVLRNAIELRYAGFLWIADLSAPENLLMGKVPFVDSLNILPIVMSLSMIWQQKMSTPAAAAVTAEQQQQQKMMMVMMPIMMLFFFYSMPSGLVLYWTTSNLLMIGQTAFRNFRKKMKEA